jgi:AcrR family transcriptional regulator
VAEAVIATVRDLRRGQIVAEARRLVAEGGLDALTIGALERRLAFSRGVITYHFDGKEEIVAAVLESAIEAIGAATERSVGAAQSVADKVVAAIRGMVAGYLEQREACLILLSFWGRLQSDERAATLNARLYAGYREDTAALLRAGIASGELPPDLPVAATAAWVVGTVIGLVTQRLFDPAAIDVAACLDEAEATARARLARGAPVSAA